MKKLPVIGITRCKTYSDFKQAVQDAGGIPKELSPGMDIDQIMGKINGLLLSGGLDIHPKYYSSDYNKLKSKDEKNKYIIDENINCDPNSNRDEFEKQIAEKAYAKGIPILGICRGFQLLNVVLGGSLISDIGNGHQHLNDGSSSKHGIVGLDPDSRVGRAYGVLTEVNSRHHQGITEVEKARCLKTVAYAPDGIVKLVGIIEAVESTQHPWAVGVQWHPERRQDPYIFEISKGLFLAFIEASAG